jgi:PKD repeat protein
VKNSNPSIRYYFREGTTPIGSFQWGGNGTTLSFYYPNSVNNSKTLNILTTQSNSCFVDTTITYKTIGVYQNTTTPILSCTDGTALCNLSSPGYGITRVDFGNIHNQTDSITGITSDFSCCTNANVVMGNTYPISIRMSSYFGGYMVRVWIDYNNDGIFNQFDELVVKQQATDILTSNITIDTTNFFNQKLRMRVSLSNNTNATDLGCDHYGCMHTQDYAITILPSPTLPTASFTKTSTSGCNTLVNLTNTGVNAVSYTWDFGDASPTVTTYNATHTYTANGTYTISLTNCNPTGCTTTTQTISVVIPQVPIPACATICSPGTIGSTNYFMIDTVYSNPNSNFFRVNSPQTDNTCNYQLNLNADRTYYFWLTQAAFSSCARVVVYIDYNNDGQLNGYESVGHPNAGDWQIYNICSNYSYNPHDFRIPSNAVRNTPLRMRVVTYSNANSGVESDACNFGTSFMGRYHDFTVFISDPLPTHTNFSAPIVTECSGVNVRFINSSSNNLNSLWDFGDGTFSTDSSSNVWHSYANSGVYSVKLKSFNSVFSDSLIRTNYITINQSLPTPDINFTAGVLSTTAIATSYKWYKDNVLISGATGASYTPTTDGAYQVSAVNTNGCGSLSVNYLHYPVHPNFTMNPTAQCANSNITFNYSTTNASYYTIDWGDGTIGGPYTTNLQYHAYANAGTYTVKMVACKNTGGCDSLIRTNYITIYPTLTPVITRNGTILSSSLSGAAYEWYKSPSTLPLSMSNTQNYNAGTNYGEYTVKITWGGCFNISAPYQYYPVSINFTADTTSYCGVSSADVQFSNSSANAVSYLWDFGDGTSSTLQSPSHIYTSSGIYTVKLVGCNGSGVCDSSIITNMIKIDPVPFISSITPTGNINACSSDSLVLSASYDPAHTYQWKKNGVNLSGATTNTYFVQNDGTYALLESNSFGCNSTSNNAIVTFDNYCVWPGDADFSHQVDNYDLIPVGMHYGSTGPPRNNLSNVWQANHASDFGTLGSNGYDIKQVDCNGDGIINMDDTLAINTNFSLTHNRNGLPHHDTINNFYPGVRFSSSTTTYHAGDWINVDVIMGTVSNQAINVYGMIFNLYSDNSLIEPGTISISYPNSWLMNNGVDGISIGKPDEFMDLTYAGLTRIDHINKTGYGKIATLRFQASNSITTTSSLYIDYDDIYPFDNAGNYIDFITNSINLTILPNSVSIKSMENNTGNDFNIIGNPLTNESKIEFNLVAKSNIKIEILNSLGQIINILADTELESGKHELSLKNSFSESKKGVYFIKYTCNGIITTKRVLKID